MNFLLFSFNGKFKQRLGSKFMRISKNLYFRHFVMEIWSGFHSEIHDCAVCCRKWQRENVHSLNQQPIQKNMLNLNLNYFDFQLRKLSYKIPPDSKSYSIAKLCKISSLLKIKNNFPSVLGIVHEWRQFRNYFPPSN